MPTIIRLTSLIFVLLCLTSSIANADSLQFADNVVVIKSQRKMYLMRNGKMWKQYAIMLGLNPVGHKEQKGDNRTPEGRYVLNGRNPASRFHRAIHISYPNEADRAKAREKGVDPGGQIAIHGLPVKTDDAAWDYIERDWTNGCIAVTNQDMDQIWELVEDGTPIEIKP